ncbi:cell division FtsK/SpoIIIE [Tolypothrix sp. NIES-4075]|uniref:DNA translocase FtsK n=1 Tax=Tolypothrix sp. NIES-4075 TaxID=2005459 RepID=UPI000B5C376D|nr:DNA translocase FtsK [Tolypothrix sp. NIES-4075]GAX43643.1 cell division FtsK/SpoIIIE [Tolypothrix sp. NIES-4075]
MQYLTEATEIRAQIAKFSLAKTLWLDTEIADWSTYYPRLSLIQVLADPTNLTSDSAYILDVLDKPDLAAYFINQIMVNPKIEKVFHNASFDLKYLGGQLAQNVTCTLKIAKKITREVLQVSNLQLKTLAGELCHFSHVDKQEQASDWGKRPLTQKQLQYAAMDTVYLAAVHRRLLEIYNPDAVSNIFNMISNDSKQSTEKSENSSLNVTKVRVAFECPRLFYLMQHFGGNTLFLPRDTAIGIGNIFHQLANDFVRLATLEPRFKELFKPPATQLQVEEIASSMQQLFYEIKFSSYLEQAKKDKIQPQTLLQLWHSLQGLIRRFAELLVINRHFCNAETVIANTFVSEKGKLEHYFNLADGTQQRVAGEFDCLVFNFEKKRLCVVEFKTYQPADPSAQLAQVALYSYMLWQKKKVAVDSAVYCVLPEFKEYHYSWEQLENTVHQLIPYKLQQMQQWLTWEPLLPNSPPTTTQPHLCEICPQQQKCQSYFVEESKEESFNKQEEQVSDTTTNHQQSVNADAIGEELVTTLQSFNIGVDYHGAAVAPSFIRVKLKPHLGVKVSSLLKLSADLQVQLGLANPPLISPQAGYVSVDLPRLDRQVAKFEEYVQHQFLPSTAPVKIALGVNLEGQLVEADLSDPNTCHFLVGGTTGSGKSEFLRSLLLSLLVRHSTAYLKIALVDPKRVTFPEFEQIPWLYSPIVKESDRAIELMDELVAEMESRYQRFEKAGCADLNGYNQPSRQPLPRIVCIFDEYADFMAEKEIRTALEQSIKRLGAKARAAGIHLIIATQRPEAKVVTPLIRSNLPGRVALRTASEADSKIILGGTQTAAASLLGKGDLLYPIGSNLSRLQSLFATTIQLPSV